MKTLLGVLVLGAVIWSQSAVAQPRGFGFQLQTQGQRGQPREAVPRDQRDPRREKRAEPQRDDRQRNSLTDEERRGLRRDIDQANRDIYRRQRSR